MTTPLPAPPPSPTEQDLPLNYLLHFDAHCPLCKYNLRHLTSPRCPECGRDLKLAVGTTEPYLLPWIAAMVALALPAGVGTVMGMIFSFIIYQEGFHSLFGFPTTPSEYVAFILYGYTFLTVPTLVLMLRFRRKFMRLSRPKQCLTAAIFWLFDGAAIVTTLIFLSNTIR